MKILIRPGLRKMNPAPRIALTVSGRRAQLLESGEGFAGGHCSLGPPHVERCGRGRVFCFVGAYCIRTRQTLDPCSQEEYFCVRSHDLARSSVRLWMLKCGNVRDRRQTAAASAARLLPERPGETRWTG